jgi:ribosome biogenesis protein NSA1
MLASVSLDRFARIHSTFPLPLKAGQRQEQKGQVLERIFMNSVPTAIIWDQSDCVRSLADAEAQKDGDDDVWDELENIENESRAEEDTNMMAKSRQTKRQRII